MHSTAKNIVAAVVGFLVGSIVNFGLITVGMSIIPPPDGMDFSTMEAVRENMKSLSPQHFIFPFLGHAVGTFVGALIASKLAATHAMRFAIGIGVAFLMGGIAMILNCGGPLWFIAADLIAAYLPMAYLGGLVSRKSPQTLMQPTTA